WPSAVFRRRGIPLQCSRRLPTVAQNAWTSNAPMLLLWPHLALPVMARHEVEAVPGYPQIYALPEPRYARDIEEWHHRPERRQLPGDPPERRKTVEHAPAVGCDDVHLFQQSPWVERLRCGREVRRVAAIGKLQSAAPVE